MDVRRLSRDFLQPWEPSWPPDATESTAFRRRLRRFLEDWRDGTAYAFFVFDRKSDDLLGGITLSNLRRGVTQSGTIGYWMGLPYVRRGRCFVCLPTDSSGSGLREVWTGLNRDRIEL